MKKASRQPLFGFECNAWAGRPKEGERYPFWFHVGINSMDWDTHQLNFFTVDCPWFQVAASQGALDWESPGPWRLRLRWKRRVWEKWFGGAN